MQEQTALLLQDHGEWVLVTDCGEPQHVWKDFDTAIEELAQHGWQVAEGPAPIRPSLAGLDRFDLWGCRLRRGIQ